MQIIIFNQTNMSPKEKALMKNKRKEYMGDQKKEEEGKMKEGKGGKDTRKNIMKEVDMKKVDC